MEIVGYIEMFAEIVAKFVEIIKNFVNSLTNSEE